MPDRRPLILLGVSGGIAAYKSAELLRDLQRAGFDVEVVLTRAARRFVQPLTFQALSGHPVHTTLWPGQGSAPEPTPSAPIDHIALAERARLLLIAPATARTLARLAHGLADDLLSTIYLATTAPVVLAPAMNNHMLAHAATQTNLRILRERGHTLVEPASGALACGSIGPGRLAELPDIVSAVQHILAPSATTAVTQDLTAETLLITAGGTREPIDPVRFLGNRSSGRMGHALAEAALSRGARVHLITASPLPAPAGSRVTRVSTAAEMHAAVLEQLPSATVLFGAAAVSDFRPSAAAPSKLPRAAGLTLTLEPTPDILHEAVLHRAPNTLVLAFAAETPTNASDLLARARAKLLRKGADAILANDVSSPHSGFDSDRNALLFVTATTATNLGEADKRTLSHRVLDQLLLLRDAKRRYPEGNPTHAPEIQQLTPA